MYRANTGAISIDLPELAVAGLPAGRFARRAVPKARVPADPRRDRRTPEFTRVRIRGALGLSQWQDLGGEARDADRPGDRTALFTQHDLGDKSTRRAALYGGRRQCRGRCLCRLPEPPNGRPAPPPSAYIECRWAPLAPGESDEHGRRESRWPTDPIVPALYSAELNPDEVIWNNFARNVVSPAKLEAHEIYAVHHRMVAFPTEAPRSSPRPRPRTKDSLRSGLTEDTRMQPLTGLLRTLSESRSVWNLTNARPI